MKNNIKVNLGCWPASQFKIVLAKRNKSLILGSHITHRVIQLRVLNFQNHDLQLVFDMEFLDKGCLEKMGVIEQVDDMYQFTFPRPIRTPGRRPSIRAGSSSALGSADDTAGLSSSVPPPPMASNVE